MTKGMKDMASIIEDEGLELAETEKRSRHLFLRIVDPGTGRVLMHPVSNGTALSWRDYKNFRAQLKRFKRGQDHGLRVAA